MESGWLKFSLKRRFTRLAWIKCCKDKLELKRKKGKHCTRVAIIDVAASASKFCVCLLVRMASWSQFFSLRKCMYLFCSCHSSYPILLFIHFPNSRAQLELSFVIRYAHSIWKRMWDSLYVPWRYDKVETEITFYEKTVFHPFIRHVDDIFFLLHLYSVHSLTYVVLFNVVHFRYFECIDCARKKEWTYKPRLHSQYAWHVNKSTVLC